MVISVEACPVLASQPAIATSNDPEGGANDADVTVLPVPGSAQVGFGVLVSWVMVPDGSTSATTILPPLNPVVLAP